MSSSKIIKNFFYIEKQRQKLAYEKNFIQLKKLYKRSLPELDDHNTPKLWDKLNSQHTSSPSFSPMEYDKLKKAAKYIKGDNIRVLNIGFGSANLEKQFFYNTRQSVEWEGIDISEDSIKRAKRIFPQAAFRKGDILKLSYSPETFDYIIALEVIEHIQPQFVFSVFESIRRILKKNGKFILSVPINEGLEEMIQRGENPNAHVRDYTLDLIKAELRLSGFTSISDKTYYAFNSQYRLKTMIARTFPFLKHINGALLVATHI